MFDRFLLLIGLVSVTNFRQKIPIKSLFAIHHVKSPIHLDKTWALIVGNREDWKEFAVVFHCRANSRLINKSGAFKSGNARKYFV